MLVTCVAIECHGAAYMIVACVAVWLSGVSVGVGVLVACVAAWLLGVSVEWG